MHKTSDTSEQQSQVACQEYLRQWYLSASGQRYLEQLDQMVQQITAEVFGYVALELGVLSGYHSLLSASRIQECFKMDLVYPPLEGVDFLSQAEALPIEASSLDLLVASHLLDYSLSPHAVLREIERVLMPEGHCILMGFNPFSFYGLGKSMTQLRRVTPCARAKTYSHWRVKEWFEVLGFEVMGAQTIGFQPNVLHKVTDYLNWMDRWGRKLHLPLGSVYILHVRKRVSHMTLVKKGFRKPILASHPSLVVNAETLTQTEKWN